MKKGKKKTKKVKIAPEAERVKGFGKIGEWSAVYFTVAADEKIELSVMMSKDAGFELMNTAAHAMRIVYSDIQRIQLIKNGAIG